MLKKRGLNRDAWFGATPPLSGQRGETQKEELPPCRLTGGVLQRRESKGCSQSVRSLVRTHLLGLYSVPAARQAPGLQCEPDGPNPCPDKTDGQS